MHVLIQKGWEGAQGSALLAKLSGGDDASGPRTALGAPGLLGHHSSSHLSTETDSCSGEEWRHFSIQDHSRHLFPFCSASRKRSGRGGCLPPSRRTRGSEGTGLAHSQQCWPVFFPLLPKCLWEVGHSPLGNLFFLGSEGPHLQQASPILDGPTIP